MRLIEEEDLARGVRPSARQYCERCRRNRPAPGFVSYDGVYLCPACATAYELARMRGTTTSSVEFASRRGSAAGNG
jgi:hypothetical protein